MTITAYLFVFFFYSIMCVIVMLILHVRYNESLQALDMLFSSLSYCFADLCVFPPADLPPPLSTLARALTGSGDITVKQCLSGPRPFSD